jgi:hypothetical protein
VRFSTRNTGSFDLGKIVFGQIELFEKLIENGIVAAAFLYILYWLLNIQSRALEEHAKSSQLANLEVARAIRNLVVAIMGMQQQLLTHDLTVSGLNPSTGATFEERDSLALRKYTDVMKTLEEQRQLLHELNIEAGTRAEDLIKK